MKRKLYQFTFGSVQPGYTEDEAREIFAQELSDWLSDACSDINNWTCTEVPNIPDNAWLFNSFYLEDEEEQR